MKIAYLVVINDFDTDHDPVIVGDEIELTLKDLGYQHVEVEIRSHTHVE